MQFGEWEYNPWVTVRDKNQTASFSSPPSDTSLVVRGCQSQLHLLKWHARHLKVICPYILTRKLRSWRKSMKKWPWPVNHCSLSCRSMLSISLLVDTSGHMFCCSLLEVLYFCLSGIFRTTKNALPPVSYKTRYHIRIRAPRCDKKFLAWWMTILTRLKSTSVHEIFGCNIFW